MHMSDLLNAMELSAYAYRDIQPISLSESMIVVDDSESDVCCYLRKCGSHLNITFRGSDSAQDWKTNLAFRKMIIPYGNTASKIRVHTGFLKAYKSPCVRNSIHNILSKDIYQVTISGHSQGAALAILCGVDLEYNFPDKDYEVLLFGSPRVGNHAFRKSYNKRLIKTLRVENGNDIVTKLPFPFMGYRHVGNVIHVGKRRIPGFFSFRDHYPQDYYKNILMLTH